MGVMDIKQRTAKIIDQQRQKLNKEIEEYKEKLYETEQYWGCGGPYRRQESAIEKREKKLEELEDFEKHLKYIKPHKKVHMYVFGCGKCQTTWMTTTKPFEDWHECPTCRGMQMIQNPKSYEISIEDQGEWWQQMLDESIKE